MKRVVGGLVQRVVNPSIANPRELRSYVIATTIVCLAVALAGDTANQLIFFHGWSEAIRSWIVTCTIVLVIAVPISLFVGRTHLELSRAKQTVSRQLAALERAHAAIEAARKTAESLARHDPLTGLANRRVFFEALDKTVARAARGTGSSAILSLDLDGFKPVNDTYGHAAGDAVLSRVADRLREIVRKTDTVARVGGDEFNVILEFGVDEEPGEGAARFAARTIERIQAPIDLPDARVEIGVSVGAALCPGDGDDAEVLLQQADVAMYRAKKDGGNRTCFFSQTMETELRARTALERDVRQAVADEAIEPHYQPLVRLADKRLAGFEILARWRHPTRGDVAPAVFIPVVEELGLMGPLTYSLLRRACLDAQRWPAEITISLNLSPTHFVDPLLPVKFLSIMSGIGFPPTRLEVEVTEKALTDDLPAAQAALKALQDIGVKIALDDFGTGYSSLYHLHELRFDKIKIDRFFVTDMDADANRARIVNSILELAKSLGIPTIAEGIEQSQTVDELARRGAEFGQGFYFGKAVPAEEAERFVRDHKEGIAPPIDA